MAAVPTRLVAFGKPLLEVQFRVQGFGFSFQGFGFRVQGLGFRA